MLLCRVLIITGLISYADKDKVAIINNTKGYLCFGRYCSLYIGLHKYVAVPSFLSLIFQTFFVSKHKYSLKL